MNLQTKKAYQIHDIVLIKITVNDVALKIFNPKFIIFITPLNVFEMSTISRLKIRCFICRV